MLEHEPARRTGAGGAVLAALGSSEAEEGDAFAAAQAYALDQIVNSIAAARENARQVREQISSEMWEQLNRLFHESKRMGTPELWGAQPHDLLLRSRESAHLFQGVTDSTMIHGEGWQFIQMGRFMERVARNGAADRPAFRGVLPSRDRSHERILNTWNGSGCCAVAPLSKPIARSTPRTCGRNAWPSFCC